MTAGWDDSAVLLVADPAVSKVPVHDNGEKLVTVPDGGMFRLVRTGVLKRLQQAAERLPDGAYLRVVEGYRPPSLQARHFADYRDGLAAREPHLAAHELDRLASRAVAPPTATAPHLSGGAVDLTLWGADGRELDMGSALNATPEQSQGACYTDFPHLTTLARRNRRWLADALSSAGFVNYPTEWWHWSFGDPYWAVLTAAEAALYGPAH